MKIRLVKDYYEFARLQQSAYASHFSGTVAEAEEATKYYKIVNERDESKVFGAFDKQLLGGYIHYDFTANFHGNMIPVAGIGSVAVDLLHKKKGVAKEMILASMKRAELDGKEMYFLYPFNSKFYQNFGFGYGVPMNTYCVAPKDFKDIGDRSILSYHDGKKYEEIIDFYDKQVDENHGMFKSVCGDSRRLEKTKGGRIILAKKDNEIIGYVHYTQSGLSKEYDQDQRIVVLSMHYNKEALLAFASFFYGQREQVSFVEIATHDPYFHYVLQDISFAKKPETPDILATKIADQGLGLMYFALQPQKLLNRLTVKLYNRLDFTIVYPDGTENVVYYGAGDTVSLKLSINHFSSWIMGAITLEALLNRGCLETEHESMLRKIDQAFYFKQPKCYTRF